MRLIKVEAQGFKSFADKVVLKFDGEIIGIVGPNGSGKSNINDAIRWVLGEISPKSLRGDAMEDVIFSGSKSWAALNEAKVSLTFDNSAKQVSLPHKYITITRVLKRSKTSEYFINNQVARLKDIKEIAMESGISKSSLAIISQGTVQDIAQASPEQRRTFFEEAAGVSKYKTRKLEAMRKLEKTSESLEKINTIVNELERQLKPLKKQAEKAAIYLQKSAQLQDIEISLLVENLVLYKNSCNNLQDKVSLFQIQQLKYQEQINSTSEKISEKTSHKFLLENEVQLLNEQYEQTIGQLNSLINQQNILKSQSIALQNDETEENLAIIHQNLLNMSQDLQDFQTIIKTQNIEMEHLKKLRDNFYQNVYDLRLDLQHEKNLFLNLEAKIQVLNDQKNRNSNLFYGVKTIMENKTLFPKIFGIVSDLIVINDKVKQAIGTIIKNVLQHVVVQDIDEAIYAINFLKKNQAGRATFIVLDEIKSKKIKTEHLQIAQKQEGFIDIASNLVTTQKQFTILVEYLLGNILVVKTIEQGALIFKIFNNYTLVSLDGNIIRPGGTITGGAREKINLFNYDDQIQRLKIAKIPFESKIKALNDKLLTCNQQYNQVINEISTLNLQMVNSEQKLQDQNIQYEVLKTKYEALSSQKFVEPKTQKTQNSIINLKNKSEKCKIELKAKRDLIINLNDQLKILTLKKIEIEKLSRELILQIAEDENSLTKFANEISNAQTRLLNKYELTFEKGLQIAKKLTIDREKALEIVNQLKKEIKELGHINLDAFEDYKKIENRYLKIASNRDELLSAQQKILSAIGQMDEIIINRFDHVFHNVNSEIDIIFKTMFGGGSASLQYTLPDNLLETGIEVKAQPPGKTVKNMKLFSGGEKALVAISLLFAIIKAKPLPLCVLDEVEAALDDTNVTRYADYLQQLKGNTQFIVITHRIGTMARVDKLYGATMQKRGVTSFFSVELAQAKNLLNKNQDIN